MNHPNDLFQVVELHDCFSANELITYEALGLCEEGKAGELIDRCLDFDLVHFQYDLLIVNNSLLSVNTKLFL